jgi:hypothetical protein
MLWTAAGHVSALTGLTLDTIPIEALLDAGSSIAVYLKKRRYSANSIRTYRQSIRQLVQLAHELGWISEWQPLAELWEPILQALKTERQASRGAIEFAIANGISPETFCGTDLQRWGKWLEGRGRQHRTVRTYVGYFRRAVLRSELEHLLFKLDCRPYPTVYRVSTSDLPEPLRTEVRELLVWKQAKFAKGRPQWTRHRPVSAKLLENCIGRLFRFAKDIAKCAGVNSLSTLFTEDVVSAFVEWGINTRNLTRSSLLRLSMLYGAMRHHPKYKSQNLSWFTTLFDQVPEDDESVLEERKAKKYVPYEVLRSIPEKIRAAQPSKKFGAAGGSWLVHDELLITWLTTLPWRQRNIRAACLGSPETANVFFAPLPTLVHIAKPKWVEDALQQNPQQSFWQFYFREDETKTGHKVRGILPRRLIPLLEEYLTQHRPGLAAVPDPGTLFMNRDGGMLDRQITTDNVGELVLKYAGRRMTPHLFRDAFAYAWLGSHPKDFLTLSKLLWQESVKYTLSVYKRNFDESNGARSIDAWLGSTN